MYIKAQKYPSVRLIPYDRRISELIFIEICNGKLVFTNVLMQRKFIQYHNKFNLYNDNHDK